MRRTCRPAPGAAIGTVWILALVCVALGPRAQAEIVYREFTGSVSAENRWFPQSGAHSGQRELSSGFVAAQRVGAVVDRPDARLRE